ncbi:MAG: hypothetical protein Q9180_003994, partial [Flavoplaca navasiana]
MSLSEQEEEDMRRAIALSLGHGSGNQQKQHEVIVVDSDSSTTDDEAPCVTAATPPKLPETESESAVDKPTMGILGLDRKAMEQERLARKRKASLSPPPARKLPKLAETTLREPTSSASTPQIDAPTKIIPSFHFSKLPHAKGAVKKTWALGHPRDNDIKLEEILQKEDLTLA